MSSGETTVRVAYLELRSAPTVTLWPRADDTVAAAATVAVERLGCADYLALYRRVGEPVRWDQRLRMPRGELEALLAGDALRIYVLRSAAGIAVGLCEFDRSAFPDVELKNFGIVPDFQGQGLGRHLLAAATEREWQTGLQRIWLHTDSWDHPAAVRLYSSLGFRVFEEREEPAGPL